MAGLAHTDSKQAPELVHGQVFSSLHGDVFQPGTSFHLMVLASGSRQPAALDLAKARTRLGSALARAGYGVEHQNLLDADVVIVARLGARADRPSIDAILTGELDPDAQGPNGIRYVQLEAYRLAAYVAFLRANEHAADDVSLQFQAWQTTVASRGELAAYSRVLGAMLDVATEHMGTNMQATTEFTVLGRAPDQV